MAKLPAPNHTQIPNALIALMPQMAEAELKVSLAIARETFGWHRESKTLSLTRLMQLTGMSRQGVINGVEAGLERGTIDREEDGQSFSYRLLVNEVDQSTELTSEQVVNEVDQASQRSGPVPVNEVDRQLVNEIDTDKEIEKKKLKEREKENKAAPPRARSGPPRKVQCSGCKSMVPVLRSNGSEVAVCSACRVDVLSQEAAGEGDSLDADTGKAVGFYKHKFREAFGREPHVAKGKDFELVRGLVREHGKSNVQAWIADYLDCKDEYVEKAGYPLSLLPGRLNALIVGKANGRASPVQGKKAQATDDSLQRFIERVSK
jgi:hypothetical protein